MTIKAGSLAATGTVELGNVSDRCIGTWVVQVLGTWAGSLVTKGYVFGQAGGLDASDAVDVSYAPDDTKVETDPGSAAITANGIYLVKADGKSIILDWTRVSGTLEYVATPLVG